jgi:hypothetical protein
VGARAAGLAAIGEQALDGAQLAAQIGAEHKKGSRADEDDRGCNEAIFQRCRRAAVARKVQPDPQV